MQQSKNVQQRVVDATSALDAALSARRDVIADLREKGWSYRRIAAHLGVSTTAIWQTARAREAS